MPYTAFRSAIDSGNLERVQQLAKSISGSVKLHDALRIVLMLRGAGRERYDRAAVRWLGRFALEARGVTVEDMQDAATLLDVLPDDPGGAMEGLSALCLSRGVT